jgi:cytidylate kinase
LQADKKQMEISTKKITIAIDGHSSCGKSTVAKDVSKELGYTYIDSGAMYRTVTLFCIQNHLIQGDTVDEHKLRALMDSIHIHFTFDANTEHYITWLNHQVVEEKIRTIEVSDQVSLVSKIGFVREKMVKLQQELGKDGGIVMDGRDIGTVVFPDAELKIFMTASSEVRAQRRYAELLSGGHKVTLLEVKENIEKRDFIDANREIAPLRQADDAVVLDNSYLTKEEQLQKIIDLVNERTK